MQIVFGAEIAFESQANIVMDKFTDSIIDYFEDKFYSQELRRLGLIIICRPKAPHIKQRNRYVKKEGTFYLDIMIDYEKMINANRVTKEILFWQGLSQLLPFIYKLKKKISDLDAEKFQIDVESLVSQYI